MSARTFCIFVNASALVLLYATVCFSEIYEPIPMEEMIRTSDLIVVGNVTDTYTELDESGLCVRYSRIKGRKSSSQG